MLISVEQDLERALALGAEYLTAGKLVAFPTETVYGLGANVWNAEAVASIFRAKGRPADNPLIAHIADYCMLPTLVTQVTPQADKLMQAFWPGPLSIILPRQAAVPDVVTAGLETIAVRWPNHPVAAALIQRAGVPVAAPSANRSGRPSPTLAEHVVADLGEAADLVIDAGMATVGLESTVVDLTTDPPTLLRPGTITLEDLQQVVGPVVLATATPTEGQARSPGMRYQHYAPAAPMFLYLGETQAVRRAMQARADALLQLGQRVGVLTFDEYLDAFPLCLTVSLGPQGEPAQAAQRLYAALRRFDRMGADVILAHGYTSNAGLGLALQNRLGKAAGHRLVWV